MFTFFTEVGKKDVIDARGRWIGFPYDFFANFEEAYPRLTHLIVKRSRFFPGFAVIPWHNTIMAEDKFELKGPLEALEFHKAYRQPGTPSLRQSILDQQVVDTFNRKIVRVNDLHFLSVSGELRLAHVDVGLRGLVRRLGWERLVDWAVRRLHRHADYLNMTNFISWKYIQPLSMLDAAGRIRLNVEQEALRQIPPSDISEMLMDLDPYQRAALLRTLDVRRQVDILTELDLKLQKDLIEDLDTRTAVELFEQMPADEATDLLQALSKRDISRIMSQISTRKAREVAELMEHEIDSAGGLMTTEFITLSLTMEVGDAIEHVRAYGGKVETVQSLYVVGEAGKLLGQVSMRQLLIEPNERKIADIIQQDPPAVHVNDSMKEVVLVFDKYNLFVVPVLGEDEALAGIITIDDIFSRVVQKAYGE